MNTFKKNIAKYLAEFIIVLVGVFFAILLGNWNTNQSNENLRQKLLTSIAIELEENKKRLDQAIEYHTAFILTLDSLWVHSEKSTLQKPFFEKQGFRQIPNWKGVGIPVLQKTYYETAVVSNIFPDMKFDLLSSITKMYEDITIHNAGREKIINQMYKFNSETKFIDVLLTIEIIRGDVLQFEKHVSNECEKTFKLIRENN
ncbi:MAG: hypothetical protein D8M58_14715 [Calditrichaeota bacterium]|nr:MAG: hypothetical protein DWQ03_15955 [Calditrichota bacterium]MBL1206655.1 hypothetical protein [Calditrichota bacterium]NOG46482.1 hypothetical protein [Calditrichota bacterium]